jgi:hypothetical protein
MSSNSSNAFLTDAANRSDIKFVIENASDDDEYSIYKTRKLDQEEDDDDETETPAGLRPISAVAPKVLMQDESQVEVSSTPAFQSLEEVNNKKKKHSNLCIKIEIF